MKEGISCLKHEQVAAKENIKPEQQPQQNPWKLKKKKIGYESRNLTIQEQSWRNELRKSTRKYYRKIKIVVKMRKRVT